MSTASERVTEFVQAWAKMRDKSDLIYGVGVDPDKDETADLLASDLEDLLGQLETARGLIAAAMPTDSDVMFWLSPEKHDWIAVRSGGNALHVRSAGVGRSSLEIHPQSPNVIDLTIRRT